MAAGLKGDFIPKQSLNGELFYNLGGKSVLNSGFQLRRFEKINVLIYTAGYTFYLPRYIFLDYKYYYSDVDKQIYSSTHLVRFNLLMENEYRLSLGYACGGEAYHLFSEQELSDVKTNTFFSQMTFWLNPAFGIRSFVSYAKRESSYDRVSLGADLLMKF